MRRALSVLPVIALALAAADTLLVRRALPHRPLEARLYLEALILWTGYALLALVPAAATLAVLARRRKRGAPERAGTAWCVLAFWTFFPVLGHAVLDAFTAAGQDVSGLGHPKPWIAFAAVAVVSIGGLWLAGPLLARAGWKATLALAVLSIGVGLFAGGSRGSTASATSAPSVSEKPNLLLLVLDTCRADHTTPYGYDRETTPHLAKLAQESLVFEEARSVSIFTFTSHLSMLTGVLPSTHGARLLSTRYDPRRATTVADRLAAAGYRTGAFVGTDVLAGRTGILHGFEVYSDRVDPLVCDTHAWKLLHDVQAVLAMLVPALRNNGQPHWFQDFQRPAKEVLAEAAAWTLAPDPRPWFCMINLYDVHWPYLPGPEAADVLVREHNGAMNGYLFRADGYDQSYTPTAADARHVADLYDAELLELDRAVHELLQRLPLERTAVLITSDHGEAFGEAGTWMHDDIFEPQLRVPLLVRLPHARGTAGGARTGRVKGLASGIDIAPTLYGLAGVEPPPGTQGIDLLAGPIDPGRIVQVEDRDHLDPADVRLALYEGSWKLVRTGLGDSTAYTLHDLENDPIGAIDVAAEHPGRVEAMRTRLEELRGDLDEREAEAALDFGAAADGLQALGYLDDE